MKQGDAHSSRGQSREASAVGEGGAWWAEGGGHPALTKSKNWFLSGSETLISKNSMKEITVSERALHEHS